MSFIQTIILAFLLFSFSNNILIKCESLFSKLKIRPNEIDASGSELVFAHVVYRHGDRNIQYTFPNDPWKDEIHWPEGYGQLSKVGKKQQYQLGKYLRRRYEKILGNQYSPNNVYIQSTDMDRTIMSSLANLAGLFPPVKEEIWNEEINWHPIPVHTIPPQMDYVLNHLAHCPKYDAAFENFLAESPEVQKIFTEYADKFLYWSKMSGENITTIKGAFDLHKTFYIETMHNKRLPEWAQREFTGEILTKIANFRMTLPVNTKELARMKIGFLLKDMLERFSQKINQTLKPDRSLWIFSGHDMTIANALNALGVFEPHIPPYASSLHFELYKNAANEHYIQIFYRNTKEENLSPLSLPKCGTKCSLERMYEIYSEVIPVDYKSECF